MQESCYKIGCIIVLFNPKIELLKKVIESVENQVDSIFFADNSNVDIAFSFGVRDTYVKMNGNLGIAAAQNVGIRHFLKMGYTHLFFLDQDSILTKGLIHQLKTDLECLNSENIPIGGIEARPINVNSGKKYQASISRGRSMNNHLTEVGEIMNSASLIPSNNFNLVGLFDEYLFIDGVDHEWCWRAHSKMNYRFFISEKAFINHSLGEGDKFLIYRPISIPSPNRVYYQFRNFFILSRRKYVPNYWKLKNGIKYILKLFYYPLFISPRWIYFKNMVRGIIHGFKSIEK